MERPRCGGLGALVEQLQTAAVLAVAGAASSEVIRAAMGGRDPNVTTWRLQVQWWLEGLAALYGRLGERQEAAQVRESSRAIARAKH